MVMWKHMLLAACCLSVIATASSRNIYLDLGVNWCNTLQLHRDLASAFPPPRPAEPFEVYGFEASPLLYPYIDEYVQWLNGEIPSEPFTCLPRSGSTSHLAAYANAYGCGRVNGLSAMRTCMWAKLKRYLETFESRGIAHACVYNHSSLISERLEQAKANRSAGNRLAQYTFIPAAVSDQQSFVTVVGSAQSMIRGGSSVQDDDQRHTQLEFRVHAVDMPKWIAESFSADDFVLVKMDVEGAEFPILNAMVKQKTAGLIDVLLWECHSSSIPCGKLKAAVAAFNVSIFEEPSTFPRTGYHYNGIDSATKASEHNFASTANFKRSFAVYILRRDAEHIAAQLGQGLTEMVDLVRPVAGRGRAARADEMIQTEAFSR